MTNVTVTSWLTVWIMPSEKICSRSTAYSIYNEECKFHFEWEPFLQTAQTKINYN